MTCEVGCRVRWLLDVMSVSSREIGAVLAERLGDNERLVTDTLAGVRAGTYAPLRDDQLACIAEYCGVPPTYFGDDAATVTTIRDEILARVQVGPYAVCRMPVSHHERWCQLRFAVHLLRSLPREESPVSSVVDEVGTESWHDTHGHDERGVREVFKMTRLDEEELAALCTSVVEECELLAPFTPRELCSRLGTIRGRRIKITATHLGATTGIGHLAPTQTTDRILIEQDAPVQQQELVIYHEVIHLLRHHLDFGDGITCGLETTTTAPSDWREWEAEVGGRALARIARQPQRPNRLSRSSGAPEHSIAAAFGFT